MRWLLRKDVLILARSRLLVALLILYPVVIALPILAVLRETAVYLHRHVELERWERSERGLL